MNRYQQIKSLTAGTLLGMSLAISGLSHAGSLALATVPLFLSNQADPNVFFEIDDSGSMDWEILAKPHPSTAAWWLGSSLLDNGLMYEGGSYYEIYLYDNPDNAYSAHGGDSISTDWRARCACMNVLAYDPAVTYDPWVGMANATFPNVINDPQPGTDGYSDTRNLTGDFYWTWSDSNSDGIVDPGEQGTQIFLASESASQQTNYANWYTYYRRRSFVAKAAVADVIDTNPGFRYGLSLINLWSGSSGIFTEVPASGVSNYIAHNNSLIDDLRDFDWPPYGTPLRQALKRTGDYFDNTLSGKTDPIISECQKNFTILITDGYWNGWSPGVGDTDGDSHSNTLADVAMEYYDTDLSPLDDNVPPDTFDTNARQHMVTFTVAFGINGDLADSDSDGWPNPVLTESGDWGNPFSSNSEKVDDLWHAAFNSKGTFIAAQTPQAVADGINDALVNITGRTSSAASVSLNGGSIGTNSRLYQVKFGTDTWTGQLLSYSIGSDATISATPTWDAGCKLTGGTCPTTGSTETGQNWDTGREIITYKPSNGNGIPFRWPANPASPTATELDTDQTTPLGIDLATGLADGQGMQRWQFLRGDTSIAGFRTRGSLLGDVIHSAPVYIGAPASNFPDTIGGVNFESALYSTFFNANKNRTPLVWFGANDGMFHGISATLGTETIAYIPSTIYENLNELASPNYVHRYYVDAAPTAGDAFFGGSWKTVIVSGLAGGGQGVFALDVTSPANLDEAHADAISLWEFSDSDDRDMGFSYGQPAIVKLNNGQWAAIFGNGYGNTHDDDNDGSTTNDSLTGNSVIYIVNIQTGAIIKKFDTGVGSSADPLSASRPNGMATPRVIDVDNDRKADYIIAGDLFGNLWKIDITDASTSNWGFYDSATSPHTPLFTTDNGSGVAQPITTAPEVSPHVNGGFMINFGTGKYIETGDNSVVAQQTQTFYGIWDRNLATLTAVSRSQLLQQTITQEISEGFDTDGDGTDDLTKEVRETSDNVINWAPSTGSVGSGHLGWYLDIINPNTSANEGERQVTDSVLLNGIIIFTTLIPSTNPCDFGGNSWIMALDSQDGRRLNVSAFDFNQDGAYDALDYISASADTASGTKSIVGILPKITFSKYDGTYAGFGSGSTGGMQRIDAYRSPTLYGRQTWRQIQ